MWGLGRYIYPGVNDAADLLVRGVLSPTEGGYLVCVYDLENELVVDIRLHTEFSLLDAYKAFWRNDVENL